MNLKVRIFCGKHPKYKAMYAPRTGCVDCQVLYNLQQQPTKTSILVDAFVHTLKSVK